MRALDEGSWAYEYRAAPFDPAGDSFPIILSDKGPGGYYPYIKHPGYPLLLLGTTRVFGEALGLHVPGLLGIVGAAMAAWFLARELDARLARPAFWMTVAGPVLVSGYVVWAHAPSAAMAGFALVGAARIARRGITPGRGDPDRRRRGRRHAAARGRAPVRRRPGPGAGRSRASSSGDRRRPWLPAPWWRSPPSWPPWPSGPGSTRS